MYVHLEGQRHLVSSLIGPIKHVVTLVIRIINLRTDAPSKYGKRRDAEDGLVGLQVW